MNTVPPVNAPGRMRRIRHIHFIGIGGAGMNGIAEVMANLGYTVTGSDVADSDAVRRLRCLDILVNRQHQAANVADADVVVVSSAIAADNVEIEAARQARIPVVPRAEMLAELMRYRQGIAVAGTHGKTTTTALTAAILAEAGLDPTFVIGGQVNAFAAGARLGSGEFLVAEADESDGSFLHLQPVIAVLTNIDRDHLEHYGQEFRQLRHTFLEFLHQLPFHGVAVICVDDEQAASLRADLGRTVVTYAIEAEADVRATDIRQDGAVTHFRLHLPGGESRPVSLALPGRHNVLNALGAAAVAWELEIPAQAIGDALAGFKGIGRRFSLLGEVAVPAGRILAVEDYAHHPTEIQATIEAARAGWSERRLVVVFQPHRYSRTRDLFDDFSRVLSDSDALVVLDIYPASEAPLPGISSRALCQTIRQRGRVSPVLIPAVTDLAVELPPLLEDGDLVLFLGAGDIGSAARAWANGGDDE